jgi:tRNAThr (cytosine32-N3)-methyltransferase
MNPDSLEQTAGPSAAMDSQPSTHETRELTTDENANTTEKPMRTTRTLGPSMEHLRRIVMDMPSPGHLEVSTPDPETQIEEPTDVYGVPNSIILPVRRKATAPRVDNPQKRVDPFQFGSRYLEEGDDIYKYNAWDNVEIDDAYGLFAEEMYQKQRDNPVNDDDKREFLDSLSSRL